MTYIIGLDLSITDTGVAIAKCDSDPFIIEYFSIPNPKRKQNDDYTRLRDTLNEVCIIFNDYPDSRVVIEDYAYNSKVGKAFLRAELSGCIRLHALERFGYFSCVAPSALKRYITGNGKAPKELMLSECHNKFGFYETNDNVVDAVCLCYYMRGIMSNERLDYTTYRL